ncbi:hypothetical protein C8R45DRAFT_1079289 [Mycena sanguinolenta]|nr:hypothetical protein C8R45DRAFT_1079289 [Mycena sanguinolenta]
MPSHLQKSMSIKNFGMGDQGNKAIISSIDSPFYSSPATESRLVSSCCRGILSMSLHTSLVAIHVVLVLVSLKGLEHQIVFSVEDQKNVSFIITAISMTVGATYSATLVFLTQTLSIRRSFRAHQALTATHDGVTAWAGIGSAVLQLWLQKALSSSIVGVLSAFLYLGNIAILHITTPALLTVQAFNSTYSVPVRTQGLPTFNFSMYNMSNEQDISDAWKNTTQYAQGSLSGFTSIRANASTLGLDGGTLYDTFNGQGIGTVEVNATGFNITCRSITDGHALLAHFAVTLYTEGIISQVYLLNGSLCNDLILYSTIPIIDSHNNIEGRIPINVEHPVDGTVQFLQCSQSLVRQTAVMDAGSQQLLSVYPAIYKTAALWMSTPSLPNWIDPTYNPLSDSQISYLDLAGYFMSVSNSIVLNNSVVGMLVRLDANIWESDVVLDTTLSMRRNMHEIRSLTATHDCATAWAGIGSAVVQIWRQKAARSSIPGVLSVFLYLGNILVLGITTPALFSLQTFSSSYLVSVLTQGLPVFDFSGYNMSDPQDRDDAWLGKTACPA